MFNPRRAFVCIERVQIDAIDGEKVFNHGMNLVGCEAAIVHHHACETEMYDAITSSTLQLDAT